MIPQDGGYLHPMQNYLYRDVTLAAKRHPYDEKLRKITNKKTPLGIASVFYCVYVVSQNPSVYTYGLMT